MAARRRLVASRGRWLVWGAVGFFLVNLFALVAAVVVNSFGTRWFDAWLPEGLTTRWYSQAWEQFALFDTLVVTLEVALAVVAISLVVGVPAAYALARRDFPGKRAVMLALLVPLVLPPLSYGIPLATVLYEARMAGTLSGVILANLVPAVPFVVLVMTPFVEQIDPNIESAARMCGAGTARVLTRVADAPAHPGHPRCRAARAGAHGRDVRADVPDRGPREPDAGGGAVQRGVRRRHPHRPDDRLDGCPLHVHDAHAAGDRAAVREPDAARLARQGGAGEVKEPT
jgi:ABC-type sulfate transport system permease component